MTILREKSETALPRLMLQKESFDLAYVDGSHVASNVLFDGVMAGRLLKVGGVLVFDDYKWPDAKEGNGPKEGIDAFILAHQASFQVLDSGYQVVLQKVAESA